MLHLTSVVNILHSLVSLSQVLDRTRSKMWLERFGNVDQNIFFGFCAVVFVVVVLIVGVVITRLRNTIPTVYALVLFVISMFYSAYLHITVLVFLTLWLCVLY